MGNVIGKVSGVSGVKINVTLTPHSKGTQLIRELRSILQLLIGIL
jgi:hypothetical protein